jgi:hypothetical protein
MSLPTECKHCSRPIEQPAGRGRTREFCSTNCRVCHHRHGSPCKRTGAIYDKPGDWKTYSGWGILHEYKPPKPKARKKAKTTGRRPR